MSRIVGFIRRCQAAGIDMDTALKMAEAFEAELSDAIEEALDVRRAKDRERQARKRAAKAVTEHNVNHVTSRDKADGHVTERDPTCERAHVRVITSNLDTTGYVGGGVGEARERASADWPAGKAADHAKLLVQVVASPRLDPSKSPGLVTTAGRLAAWQRDGASWEHDVVPVVTALCGKQRSAVSSWKFFDAAIARSIADNRAALEIPEAGVRATGPPGITDRIAAEMAEARRRVLES